MIQISPITPNDIPNAAVLLDYSWMMHAKKNDLYSAAHFAKDNMALDWLSRNAANSKFHTLVAKIDTKLAGLICLEIQDCPSYFTHKNQLFVVDVVVAKGFQGQGVATELEKSAESLARELGIHQISGHVDTWNKASQALMQKLHRVKGYEEWHKIL